MILIPVQPEPYAAGRRGLKQDPMKDYTFAIQSYLPVNFPIKTICFVIESKTDSGNLTEDGPCLWSLAKGFMNAISKTNTITRTPAFEKRTGTISGIYVY